MTRPKTPCSDKHSGISHCPHNAIVSCNDCSLSKLCIPLALENSEISQLDDVIKRSKPLQKAELIYREGGNFRSIFAIRAGTVKTYSTTSEGEEQITGFYFPGEILGMDSIGQPHYNSSAETMEVASICEIPFSHVEQLSAELPNLQKHFFGLLSREIHADQRHFMLLSKNTAEERVASLLLSISARNARRHLSATLLRLPMSRSDIGNFLGLTLETVSRVLSRLAKQGVIAVNHKEVQLIDLNLLRDIARIDA